MPVEHPLRDLHSELGGQPLAEVDRYVGMHPGALVDTSRIAPDHLDQDGYRNSDIRGELLQKRLCLGVLAVVAELLSCLLAQESSVDVPVVRTLGDNLTIDMVLYEIGLLMEVHRHRQVVRLQSTPSR